MDLQAKLIVLFPYLVLFVAGCLASWGGILLVGHYPLIGYGILVGLNGYLAISSIRIMQRRLGAVASPFYYLYAVKEMSEGRKAPTRRAVMFHGIFSIVLWSGLACTSVVSFLHALRSR